VKSGTITLYRLPGREESFKLDRAEGLKKGGHYYDLPRSASSGRRNPGRSQSK
jgi:hypothetical protein